MQLVADPVATEQPEAQADDKCAKMSSPTKRPRAVGEHNENAVDPDLTAGPEDVSRDDGIRAYGAQDYPARMSKQSPMESVVHAGDHCWGHAVSLPRPTVPSWAPPA